MAPVTSKYERPDVRRFVPEAWEKQIVTIKWIDCDPVARAAIEGQYYSVDWPMHDRHGYPAS